MLDVEICCIHIDVACKEHIEYIELCLARRCSSFRLKLHTHGSAVMTVALTSWYRKWMAVPPGTTTTTTNAFCSGCTLFIV